MKTENKSENVASDLTQVDTNMQIIKNLIENMTQENKLQIVKHIIDKNNEDDTVFNFTLMQMIDKLGINNVESALGKLTKKIVEDEPILNENTRKFTAFPIQYQNIWKKYKEQVANFWIAEEIDFSNDYNDFMTLSEDEKYFIEMILAFFAASDGIVNFNLSERFIKEVQNTEIIFTYQFQAMMENIHCCSGDTQILTDKGYFKLIELLEKNVKVWNGKEFTDTVVKFTGKSNLYRVELSNGMHLDCTPEHKWFINDKKNVVFSKDLKKNYIISNYQLPILDTIDEDNFMNPYIHGFYSGSCYDFIFLRNERRELLTYLNTENYKICENEIIVDVSDKINKERYFVPINYSIETKLKWLEGLFDSDTLSNPSGRNAEIKLYHNEDFLKKIQLLLTTLNIQSTIQQTKLQYISKYLVIDDYNFNLLMNMDFEPNVKVRYNIKKINKLNQIKIKKITKLEGIHDTYCFCEPKEHAGIFNGILTGQSEVYSLMLDNIVKDTNRREFLFNAIKNVESVKMMADWAFKWIDSSKSFAHRIIAFAIVEGVFFSGAFAAIFWIKKFKNKNRDHTKGKAFMDGLIKSNKFISRDESHHMKFACEIYGLLNKKLSTNEVNEIMREGVQISKKFMTDALPVKLIGMSNQSMCDYIEYIGDRLLIMLGHKKIFNKNNPFKFMETMGLNDKSNFFETRTHEYTNAYTHNVGDKSKLVFKEVW